MMKLPIILFLSLMLYVSVTHAKQKTNHASIQQLIQKVKNSSGDDRRVAMNTLKVKLRSMNQETRQKVMHDLQKNFSNTQHSVQKSVQSTSHQSSLQAGNTGVPSSIPQTQVPYTQPSTPQVPSPKMPSPYFGQPGGRK